MGVTAVAVAIGLAAGLLAGGRPSGDRHTFRLWPALLFGVVAQWLPDLPGVPDGAAPLAVACSYLALIAFAVANLRLVGMPVVLVGLVLNMAVIVANGGMPVRVEALVAAGIVEADEVSAVDLGPKRHLEEEADVLAVLGDVLPVAPLREVISFGDLILAAGVADVAFRLLKPTVPRRRRLPTIPRARAADPPHVGR